MNLLGKLGGKTKAAALALAAVAFLQLLGVSVPPEVVGLINAVALYGGRDALQKLIETLKASRNA